MTKIARTVVLSVGFIGFAALTFDAIAHPKVGQEVNNPANEARVTVAQSDHIFDTDWGDKSIKCSCLAGEHFEVFGVGFGAALGGPSALGVAAGGVVGWDIAKVLHEGAHQVYEHRHEILDAYDEAFEIHHDVTGETFFTGPKY